MTEGLPSSESREEMIDRLLEELAQREGMEVEEMLPWIIEFANIAEGGDTDVMPYFDMVKEKTGISFEEVVAYAKNIVEGE